MWRMRVPLSVEFPRQEYWSRLPFPSPRDLPNQGIKLTSPILQVNSLPLSHQGSPIYCMVYICTICLTWPVSWESWMQVKKQQSELDMEQLTGSKLGKEYNKAIYCHPAYLTYMQSTSWEMLYWKKHNLESRFLGEISTTSDRQMIPIWWQKVKRD